jgi:ribosomal peptide maturation radical SAM protein 1
MDLLLATMPFADLDRPPLGLSLLQAAVRNRGFTSAIRYFYLKLPCIIGSFLYDAIMSSFGMSLLAGDWMFAEALFAGETPPSNDFLKYVIEAQRVFDIPTLDPQRPNANVFTRFLEEDIFPDMIAARKKCTAFVAEAADEIMTEAPRLVGFTVSIQQICATLAVVRQLKKSPDAPKVILGGPACFGEIGAQILRSFQFVDYVCTGEGDQVFPVFVEQMMRTGNGSPVPGILKQGSSHELTFPPLTRDLDKLPIPDFHDFFEQLSISGTPGKVSGGVMPYETSRGCWWGERRRCGFCGNPLSLQAYRSKSPERVLEELKYLNEAYKPTLIGLDDDVLNMRHYRTLYASLASSGEDLSFCCQTRVNLTREQLRILKAAGGHTVWFGIETLSNRLLKLLPKGCSAQQAIQVLRWSQELGILSSWNILYGICGENPETIRR